MQEEASTSQAQTSGTSDISDELRALQQRKRQQSQSAAPTGYIQVVQAIHNTSACFASCPKLTRADCNAEYLARDSTYRMAHPKTGNLNVVLQLQA